MIAVGPAHGPVLAAIHAQTFPPSERWSAEAFTALLAGPGVIGLLGAEGGGFVLARRAADEAELLTVAVLPERRREGLGRRLLLALGKVCPVPTFLEVAATNEPALALYRGLDWAEVGRRRDYYGAGRHALVLRWAPPQSAAANEHGRGSVRFVGHGNDLVAERGGGAGDVAPRLLTP
jgi:[ribosomal protein S18]-alanine N-acetyltransferase